MGGVGDVMEVLIRLLGPDMVVRLKDENRSQSRES